MVVAGFDLRRGELAGVLGVVIQPVLDPRLALHRSAVRGERADGDPGGAAELRILLQQQNVGPVLGRTDGGGQSAASAAYYDGVKIGLHHFPSCSGRWRGQLWSRPFSLSTTSTRGAKRKSARNCLATIWCLACNST